eukprot:g5183.t1
MTSFRRATRTPLVASAPHKITKSARSPQQPAEAQRDENVRRKPRRLKKGKHNEVERKRRKHQASAKDAKTCQPKWIERLLQDEAEGLAAPKADDNIFPTRGPGRSQSKATFTTGDSPVASAAASEAVGHLSPAVHDSAGRSTTLRRIQTMPHDGDGYCGLAALGRLLQIENPRELRRQIEKAITDKDGRRRILKQGVTTLKQIHTILLKNKIAAVAYPVHEWPKESGAVFLTPEQLKKGKVIGSKEVQATAGLVAGGGHVEVVTRRQWAELSIDETTLTQASTNEQELKGSLHGKKAKIKMSLPALKKNIATLLQIKDTTEIPIFEQASSGSLRVLAGPANRCSDFDDYSSEEPLRGKAAVPEADCSDGSDGSECDDMNSECGSLHEFSAEEFSLAEIFSHAASKQSEWGPVDDEIQCDDLLYEPEGMDLQPQPGAASASKSQPAKQTKKKRAKENFITIWCLKGAKNYEKLRKLAHAKKSSIATLSHRSNGGAIWARQAVIPTRKTDQQKSIRILKVPFSASNIDSLASDVKLHRMQIRKPANDRPARKDAEQKSRRANTRNDIFICKESLQLLKNAPANDDPQEWNTHLDHDKIQAAASECALCFVPLEEQLECGLRQFTKGLQQNNVGLLIPKEEARLLCDATKEAKLKARTVRTKTEPKQKTMDILVIGHPDVPPQLLHQLQICLPGAKHEKRVVPRVMDNVTQMISCGLQTASSRIAATTSLKGGAHHEYAKENKLPARKIITASVDAANFRDVLREQLTAAVSAADGWSIQSSFHRMNTICVIASTDELTALQESVKTVAVSVVVAEPCVEAAEKLVGELTALFFPCREASFLEVRAVNRLLAPEYGSDQTKGEREKQREANINEPKVKMFTATILADQLQNHRKRLDDAVSAAGLSRISPADRREWALQYGKAAMYPSFFNPVEVAAPQHIVDDLKKALGETLNEIGARKMSLRDKKAAQKKKNQTNPNLNPAAGNSLGILQKAASLDVRHELHSGKKEDKTLGSSKAWDECSDEGKAGGVAVEDERELLRGKKGDAVTTTVKKDIKQAPKKAGAKPQKDKANVDGKQQLPHATHEKNRSRNPPIVADESGDGHRDRNSAVREIVDPTRAASSPMEIDSATSSASTGRAVTFSDRTHSAASANPEPQSCPPGVAGAPFAALTEQTPHAETAPGATGDGEVAARNPGAVNGNPVRRAVKENHVIGAWLEAKEIPEDNNLRRLRARLRSSKLMGETTSGSDTEAVPIKRSLRNARRLYHLIAQAVQVDEARSVVIKTISGDLVQVRMRPAENPKVTTVPFFFARPEILEKKVDWLTKVANCTGEVKEKIAQILDAFPPGKEKDEMVGEREGVGGIGCGGAAIFDARPVSGGAACPKPKLTFAKTITTCKLCPDELILRPRKKEDFFAWVAGAVEAECGTLRVVIYIPPRPLKVDDVDLPWIQQQIESVRTTISDAARRARAVCVGGDVNYDCSITSAAGLVRSMKAADKYNLVTRTEAAALVAAALQGAAPVPLHGLCTWRGISTPDFLALGGRNGEAPNCVKIGRWTQGEDSAEWADVNADISIGEELQQSSDHAAILVTWKASNNRNMYAAAPPSSEEWVNEWWKYVWDEKSREGGTSMREEAQTKIIQDVKTQEEPSTVIFGRLSEARVCPKNYLPTDGIEVVSEAKKYGAFKTLVKSQRQETLPEADAVRVMKEAEPACVAAKTEAEFEEAIAAAMLKCGVAVPREVSHQNRPSDIKRCRPATLAGTGSLERAKSKCLGLQRGQPVRSLLGIKVDGFPMPLSELQALSNTVRFFLRKPDEVKQIFSVSHQPLPTAKLFQALSEAAEAVKPLVFTASEVQEAARRMKPEVQGPRGVRIALLQRATKLQYQRLADIFTEEDEEIRCHTDPRSLHTITPPTVMFATPLAKGSVVETANKLRFVFTAQTTTRVREKVAAAITLRQQYRVGATSNGIASGGVKGISLATAAIRRKAQGSFIKRAFGANRRAKLFKLSFDCAMMFDTQTLRTCFAVGRALGLPPQLLLRQLLDAMQRHAFFSLQGWHVRATGYTNCLQGTAFAMQIGSVLLVPVLTAIRKTLKKIVLPEVGPDNSCLAEHHVIDEAVDVLQKEVAALAAVFADGDYSLDDVDAVFLKESPGRAAAGSRNSLHALFSGGPNVDEKEAGEGKKPFTADAISVVDDTEVTFPFAAKDVEQNKVQKVTGAVCAAMEVYCCGAELFLGNDKCEAMVIAHDGDGDENDEKQTADKLKGTLRIFGKPFAMRREIKLFGIRIPSRIGGSKADATFRAQAKQAIYLGEIIAKEAFKGRSDVNARSAWATNDWCITARVRHLLVVRAIEQCGEQTPNNDATTQEILAAACTSRLRLVGCQQEIVEALRPAYVAALLQGIQKTARKTALKWMQQYTAARDSPQTILVACLGLQPEDQDSRRKVLESDAKAVSSLPPSREVVAVFQCKNNTDQQDAQSHPSCPAQNAITIAKVDGTNAAVTSRNEAGQGEVGEQENREVRVEVFAPSGWEDEKPPEVEAEDDMDDLLLQRFQELLEDERTERVMVYVKAQEQSFRPVPNNV